MPSSQFFDLLLPELAANIFVLYSGLISDRILDAAFAPETKPLLKAPHAKCHLPFPSMYQEANENLEDAGNELILSDEDVVRFQIGEVFAHMPVDDVEAKLEQMKEDAAKKLERLEEEKESILTHMAELKEILYGKFGKAINLEED
ncbi:unnamed protein product [Triticum turgidum subsp. durum]|uniref:Prefoldin subunit 4 n=1 Tax=Triticum turgidum subsp. durum TaxID=4567 RepID=A0A9R0WSQ6_TRITD|nr:unnamed protein product [Triticum turgidum subsp. durum]